HRSTGATNLAQPLVADRDDVVLAEEHGPGCRRRLRQQAQDGLRGHGLAASTLTNNGEHLAGLDRETHAVDSADIASVGRKRDREVVDLDSELALREVAHARVSNSSLSNSSLSNSSLSSASTASVAVLAAARLRVRSRGSARSLRLSPTRVMPSTTSTIASPGKIEVHQIPAVTSEIDLLRSKPHSAAEVGSIPKPRNPRPARVRIASDALSVKISGSVLVELRSTCRNMMRAELDPMTFADSTNASDLIRTTSERTTLKYCGMNTTVIEIAAARMPPNSCERPPEITIDITIASSSDGNA